MVIQIKNPQIEKIFDEDGWPIRIGDIKGSTDEGESIVAKLLMFILAIILLTILIGIVWFCFWVWNGIGI